MKRYVRIFVEFFKISLFVIGGGYAILAVADQVFAKRKWTEEGELLDVLPIFQMLPGIIATHTAVYVGRKVAGLPGAATAVVAVALPSVVIFTVGGVPVWAVLLAAMAAGLVVAFSPTRARGGRTFCAAAWLPLLLFLKYGALCFGGGFVLVPMYIEDFVGPTAAFLQVSAEEFSNLMALTQMTPGPIGVNGATYFGFRLAGVPGAVLASVALLLPGSVLVYLAFASIDRFRTSRLVGGILRGAKPASLALMLVALWAFLKLSAFADGSFQPLAALLVLVSFVLSQRKAVHPVLLIVGMALVSLVVRLCMV